MSDCYITIGCKNPSKFLKILNKFLKLDFDNIF